MKSLHLFIMRWLYRLSWPLSGLFLHNSHRVRVALRSGNKILLVKTSLGPQKWELPGGGVKRSESARAALSREVQEEVGITIDPLLLILLGREHISDNRLGWPKKDIEMYSYEVGSREFTVKRPLEICDARWFDMSSLPSDVLSDVRRAVRYL